MAKYKDYINPYNNMDEDTRRMFEVLQGGYTGFAPAKPPESTSIFGQFGQLGKGFAEGAYSTVSGLGEFAAMMGLDNPVAGSGNKFSDWLGQTGYQRPEDFGFSNFFSGDYWKSGQAARDIGMTAGSVASFFIPAIGVAKGASTLGNIGKLGKLGQTVVAGTAMSALESATEAGNTYQDLYEKTGDKSMAQEKGMQVLGENMGLLTATNIPELALAFAGPEGKVLSSIMKSKIGRIGTKVIGDAAIEGFQEKVQQAIQSAAMGEQYTPWYTAPWNWTPEEKYAGGLGAIGGGIIGGGIDLAQNKMQGRGSVKTPKINDQNVALAEGKLTAELPSSQIIQNIERTLSDEVPQSSLINDTGAMQKQLTEAPSEVNLGQNTQEAQKTGKYYNIEAAKQTPLTHTEEELNSTFKIDKNGNPELAGKAAKSFVNMYKGNENVTNNLATMMDHAAELSLNTGKSYEVYGNKKTGDVISVETGEQLPTEGEWTKVVAGIGENSAGKTVAPVKEAEQTINQQDPQTEEKLVKKEQPIEQVPEKVTSYGAGTGIEVSESGKKGKKGKRISLPIPGKEIPVKNSKGELLGVSLPHTETVKPDSKSRVVITPQVTLKLKETKITPELKQRIESQYGITPNEYKIKKIKGQKGLYLESSSSRFNVETTGKDFDHQNLDSVMKGLSATKLQVQTVDEKGKYQPLTEYHPAKEVKIQSEESYNKAVNKKSKETVAEVIDEPQANKEEIKPSIKKSSEKENIQQNILSQIKTISPVEFSGNEAIIAGSKKLKEILGINIKLFTHDNEYFNGFFHGDTLYINSEARMSMKWIIGHEAGHAMQKYNPQLFRELTDAINITDAQIQKYSKNVPTSVYNSKELLKEEMMMDTIGNMFESGDLFTSLINKNESLYERVIKFLKKWYSKLSGKIKEVLTPEQARAISNVIHPIITGQKTTELKQDNPLIAMSVKKLNEEQDRFMNEQHAKDIEHQKNILEMYGTVQNLKEAQKMIDDYKKASEENKKLQYDNIMGWFDNLWLSPHNVFAKVDKQFPEFKNAMLKMWESGKGARDYIDRLREDWSKDVHGAWSRLETEQERAEFEALRRFQDMNGTHVSQVVKVPVGMQKQTDVVTGTQKEVPKYQYVVIDSMLADTENKGAMFNSRSKTEAMKQLSEYKGLFDHAAMSTVQLQNGERYAVFGWNGNRVFNSPESAAKFASNRTEQILKARGIGDNVIKSLVEMNGFYHRVYDLVSAMNKGLGEVEPVEIKGYLPHYVDNWVFNAEFKVGEETQKHMASFPSYSDAEKYAAHFLTKYKEFDPKFNIIGRKEYTMGQSKAVNASIDSLLTQEDLDRISKANELDKGYKDREEFLNMITETDAIYDEKINRIIDINKVKNPEGLTAKQWRSKLFGGTVDESTGRKLRINPDSSSKAARDLSSLTKKLDAKGKENTLITAEELRRQYIGVGGKRRSVTFLHQRKNTGAYSLDMERVDYKYMMAMSRYLGMAPWKLRATKLYRSIFNKDYNDPATTDFQRYLQQYIHDVNGDPTWVEKRINEWIQDIPILKKYLAKGYEGRWSLQAINTINDFNMITKLGWNLSSVMMQFSTVLNTYAKIGHRWTGIGMAKAANLSEKDKSILSEMKIDKAYSPEVDAAYNRLHKSGQLNENMFMSLARKGMVPFYWADQKARQISALGGYYFAYNQFKGMPESERHRKALIFGRDLQDMTNFDSSIWDSPGIMRYGGPLSKMVMQFKTYGLKQLEFTFTHLQGAEKVRFWTSFGLIVGLAGFPGGEFLNQMIKAFTGNQLDVMAEVKKTIYKEVKANNLPESVGRTLLYGLAGINKEYGVDITSRIGMYDYAPSSMSSLLGPTASSLWTLRDIFINNPIDNLSASSSNVIRAFMPGIGNALLAMEGESINPRDRARLDIKYTDYEAAARFFGFTPVRESEERTIANLAKNVKTTLRDSVQDAIDRFIADPSPKNRGKLAELKITRQQIADEIKKKKETRAGRALEIIPKKYRNEYSYLNQEKE